MKQSVYKVPNGKMIKIKVAVDGKKITTIIITGDFFLHPEDTLFAIEKNLAGTNLEENALIKSIQSTLEKKGAILIGADALDIAKAILQA